MSKNQSKSSSSGGSGNIRGDVSFIRAISSSEQSATTSGSPSSQHKGFDNIPIQHFNMGPSHLPHQSHSSQEISHQGFPSIQDMPHHSHSLHHYHPRGKQQQQTQQSAMEQYHPDIPDQNLFMGGGGGGGEPLTVPVHTGVESWGTKEEALSTELDEAKIRVAQMEKTMRWWSDCTSNWREKWNKARNERNKAREENRILRVKLESVSKDLSRLKREKRELAEEKETNKGEGKLSKSLENLSEKEKTILAKANEKECESTEELSEASSPKSALVYQEKDVDNSEAVQGGDQSRFQIAELESKTSDRIFQLEEELLLAETTSALAHENVTKMHRELDKANNTIEVERLENCNQIKVIENMKKEMEEMQSSLDEAIKSKTSIRKETRKENDEVGQEEGEEEELDAVKDKYRDDLNRLSLDLEDESNSRSSMDRHVMDLRRELERLQSENACEWGKRERLESEKLVLERDNKKLRTQVKDLEEEVERRTQASSSSTSSDIKTLEFELVEKTKELSELKHVSAKLKKVLGDRGTEMDHSKRRAEQYEAEVRKLRGRIDELKHDLAQAEDEVDSQSNAARKAQRSNDELQEQVDSLQVQVNHLQSRLRSGGPPRSSSIKAFSLEDAAEFADSENDFDEV